ncbi:MAG TPA: hypothetical protein VI365_36160 [Trebonia sp.]
MNATYARDGADETRSGKIILMAISSLSALLVIAGLIYATGTSERSASAAATAGCEPGLTSEGHPCITQPMLASEYMAIATPATQQQKVDVAAYTASEGDNLAAAETALTAEVTSDHAFDANLAGIEFPSAIAPIAAALIRANQARASLIAEQARSTSLKRLRSFIRRVQAASTAVQTQMNLILKAIDAPLQAN